MILNFYDLGVSSSSLRTSSIYFTNAIISKTTPPSLQITSPQSLFTCIIKTVKSQMFGLGFPN